jgi:hypothetical protein
VSTGCENFVNLKNLIYVVFMAVTFLLASYLYEKEMGWSFSLQRKSHLTVPLFLKIKF